MCERQWKPFLNGETFNCYIRFLVIPLAEKQGNPAIYSLWLRFMNISQIIPQMEQHILSKIKGLESNLGLYLF